MKYSDWQRIEKIKTYTDKLLNYIKDNNISQDNILESETVRWTLTTPLYNIGEHAYYLSDEFRQEHMNIPWNKISGLRHRLVHDYEDTNWTIICDILFKVLPEFRKQLSELDNVKQEEIDDGK